MQHGWVLIVAGGFFATSALSVFLASRHLKPSRPNDRPESPQPTQRGRFAWDDFGPTGKRWLALHWVCLLAFALCLMVFLVLTLVVDGLATTESMIGSPQ
jgi:hypothetical protein